jgi:hypothetical protein
VLSGPVPLCGLPAKGTERPEVALGLDQPLHRSGTERADQLVFQVGDADVEAEPLQVGAIGAGAEACSGQAAAEIALLFLVAQARQGDAEAPRAEYVKEVPDVRRTAHRHDEDLLLGQVLAAARGQRFQSGLVARPLHEDDRTRVGRPGHLDQGGQRLVVHLPSLSGCKLVAKTE